MRTNLWGAGALTLLLLSMTACASSEFAAVNTEPGYYYGFGAASTEADAQAAAFQDLVYNTLTESGSVKKERRLKANLTDEMKAAIAPLALKPFQTDKKSETSFSAIYRIKFADWTKAETARLAKLQGDLGGRFDAIAKESKKTVGERLTEAVRIGQAVDKNGVTLSLRVGAEGSALLSEALVTWAKDQFAGSSFRFVPDAGLVDAAQLVSVTFLDKAGKPLSGIPVTLTWSTEVATAPAVAVVTDAKGVASAAYPTDTKFRNAKPSLKVVTRIASLVSETTFLGGLDAGLKAEASYRNSVILANLKTEEVRVEAGTYTVGAIAGDRRAGRTEKARTATVAAFYIEKTPVTNAQYRSFLVTTEVPQSQWPDFIDGDDAAAPDEPVVGVTLEQAQKYAQWVSSVLGVKKRLPTEDEYEIAARAGKATIFPWGDQSPTDGVRANYKGNKRFDSTSPVGSFPNGANAWGLTDMVGNVWQWTTTSPDANITADPSFKIVKGGSWLDGPNELRISNRKAVDPTETATDLGFRLVREEN